MPAKVNTTLLSAAVISGLLVSGAPAQAAETTEESVHSVVVEQPATAQTPETSPVVSNAETSATVMEPAGAATAEESSVAVEANEPSVGNTTDEVTTAAETSPAQEPTQEPANGTEPSVPSEDTAAAPEASTQPVDEVAESEESVPSATDDVLDFGYVEGSQPDEEDDTSQNNPLTSFLESEEGQQLAEEFGDLEFELGEDDEAFWESASPQLPEGSEEWDEAQWEAFYDTEEGQEFIQVIEDEYTAGSLELTEEEEQLLEEMLELLPEDAEDWNEEQWVDYFQTEAGEEYLALVLTYMLDTVSSDAELEELIEMLRADFPLDAQWLENFLAFYFGEEHNGSEEQTPEEEVQATPSPQPGEVKPVGQVEHTTQPTDNKSSVEDTTARASGDQLADTGFSSVLLAGAGALLLLAGAVLLRRRHQA